MKPEVDQVWVSYALGNLPTATLGTKVRITKVAEDVYRGNQRRVVFVNAFDNRSLTEDYFLSVYRKFKVLDLKGIYKND